MTSHNTCCVKGLQGQFSINHHHYIHLLGLPHLTLLEMLHTDEGWSRNASALHFWANEVQCQMSCYFPPILFFTGVCLPLIRLLFLVEHSSKTFIQWSTLLSLLCVCNIFMLYVKYSECIWNHMVCNKDQWLFIYRYWMLMANYSKYWWVSVSFVLHIFFCECLCLLQGHKTRLVNVLDQSDVNYQNPLLSHFTLQHWFVEKGHEMVCLSWPGTCVARMTRR